MGTQGNFPSISVVIPTRNSARTLERCLRSIITQDYPQDKLEVIVVDAYSNDATIKIASAFGCKVVPNPRLTGEAGKALGARIATGEYILFIDSDNVLVGSDWLRRMIEPMLSDAQIIASEALYYGYNRFEPAIIRYCALMGADDPLMTYLGFHGRYSYLTSKWSGIPMDVEDKGSFLLVDLSNGLLPTMGANGFLIKRTY